MTSTRKGRPRSITAYTRWDVHLDAALAAEVEMLQWDNLHMKPRYGSRKALLESLLRKWIEEQRQIEGLYSVTKD